MLTRRALCSLFASWPLLDRAQSVRPPDPPADWVCPMDADVRSSQPGKCPRCGMTLRVNIPARTEYRLKTTHEPAALLPAQPFTLHFSVQEPGTSSAVRHFEIVHEKLLHLFIVSEDLEYFAHVHPVPEEGGSFRLRHMLPKGGMYRLLADYYPTGGVPQLSEDTLLLPGVVRPLRLRPQLTPAKAANLTASLHLDPTQPVAGLETKLFFRLRPADHLEPYLGAWAHMLAASDDLIDLLHLHPFLASGTEMVQFNLIFPRPALYRLWTQFQRAGVVNTVVFTIPVRAL